MVTEAKSVDMDKIDMYEFTDEDEDLNDLDRGDEVPDLEDEDSDDEDEEIEDEDSDEDSDDDSDDESGDTSVDDEDSDDDEGNEEADLKYQELIALNEEQRERNKWLEAQIEKLLDQPAPAKDPGPEYDFEEAEIRYGELLAEHEYKDAASLRKEIEAERFKNLQKLIETKAEEVTTIATQRSSSLLDDDKFENLRETFESKYPFLDSKSNDYNDEAVDTVNVLMSGYLASGMNKNKALREAVKKAVPMYLPEVKTNKAAESSQKKSVKNTRAKIKASKRQPPEMRKSVKTEVDLSKLDIAKMSDNDLDKLSVKELKELRGDF